VRGTNSSDGRRSREQRRLHLIANNTRFVILPFVRVPHLASWILGQLLRRLSTDWEKKYGHGIALVETFVERDRFAGTSYKAANWVCSDPQPAAAGQDQVLPRFAPRQGRLHLFIAAPLPPGAFVMSPDELQAAHGELKAEAIRLREEKDRLENENVDLRRKLEESEQRLADAETQIAELKRELLRPEVGPADAGTAGATLQAESGSRSGIATSCRGKRRYSRRRRRGREEEKNRAGPLAAVVFVTRCPTHLEIR